MQYEARIDIDIVYNCFSNKQQFVYSLSLANYIYLSYTSICRLELLSKQTRVSFVMISN